MGGCESQLNRVVSEVFTDFVRHLKFRMLHLGTQSNNYWLHIRHHNFASCSRRDWTLDGHGQVRHIWAGMWSKLGSEGNHKTGRDSSWGLGFPDREYCQELARVYDQIGRTPYSFSGRSIWKQITSPSWISLWAKVSFGFICSIIPGLISCSWLVECRQGTVNFYLKQLQRCAWCPPHPFIYDGE
jgi:hypothetical protein